MSPWTPGTGRSSRPRRSPTVTASTRCPASSPTPSSPTSGRVRGRRTAWGRGGVRPARAALRARYLLSGFLSPYTNRRTDEYGGDVHARLRFPLEVFAAMREVWPADRPMTVRISATDWVEGGQTLEESLVRGPVVRRGRSGGDRRLHRPVTSAERPAFGRSYQTPYADAIRNRSASHHRRRRDLVLRRRELDPARRRADLCALGRAHLYDPSWTLHAAVEQEYDGPGAPWPPSWRAVAASRRPAAATARSRGCS